MSGKIIDQKVVEMQFDNQRFEKNVQTSLSTLERLKQALRLDGAASEFEKLEKASGNVNMSGLSGAVETVRAKFSALEVVGMTALANITNSAIDAGKRIAKALTIDPIKTGFQEYETQINAVQTILANTSSKGTTLEQVNEALDELNHYADKTIYNFTEMTRNIGTFTAAGVDLNTSVSAIKGIANLAAVSGSTSQQASTAMYQLSQALAAGTVKLMDWNSVVNAGMGGQVFQDALKETARVHGIAIDQMIEDEGSFRETLSKGWLSSEILTETLEKFTGDLSRAQLLEKGYTEEQVDAIMKMGQTANDAATKVKTFTQLVDTLKEAAQSGWTETWETIVGDFEDAKGLWTGISDAIGNMINESSAARNELLSGALDSGWSNFLKEGITDAVGFKESIVEAARAHGVAIEDLAANTDKFEDSLNQEWLNADILSDALTNLTAKTAGLSDKELANLGYTRGQVTALEDLNKAVQDGSIDLDEYAAKMARMSGRENLIQSFWNVWDALFAVPKEAGDLVGIITTIRDAFREIFPPSTAEQIYGFTEGLKNLTKKFKMSSETAEKLKRTFKGLFSVFDIIGSFVKTTMKTAFDLLSSALGGVNFNILDTTASIGDAIVSFRDWLNENNVFVKGLTGLANGLKLGAQLIREWIERLMSLPAVQEKISEVQGFFTNALSVAQKYFSGGVQKFNEFLERVRALNSINLNNIGAVLKDFRDNVLGYFVTIGGRFTSFGQLLEAAKGKLMEFLTGARGGFDSLGNILKAGENRVKNYFSGLLNGLSGTLKKIVDFIISLKEKVNVHLGEILTVGIGAGLIITVKKIGDALELLASPFEALANIGKNFSNVLKGLSNTLNAFAAKTKSEALVNIAKSIAILVASIAVLTLLDQDRLLSAVAVLGGLAVGLVAVSAALGALSKVGSGQKVSLSFTALAAALLILATALKKMESLDGDKVWGDLGIIGLMTAGLTAASVVMSRLAPQLSQGSIFLLSFAASLKILISAMKDLEDLNVSSTNRAIPILLTMVGGLSLVAAVCGNLKLGSAVGILAISASLGILAGTFQKLAGMDLSGAKSSIDAFIAIFASFAAIMAASQLAGANAAKAGVGILAMSVALLLLVPAIKGLGNIDPLDMERATDAISKLLIVFALVTAASKLAGENAAKAGAMLLMMSGALVILSAVMVLLSHIEPEGLDHALAAITQLELVFAALIAVTHFAEDVKGTLTILAVSIGLLAVALGALSFINPENLKSASTSLSLVMGVFALVIASTGLAKKANAEIIIMTLAVGAMAGILAALSMVHAENTIANATALSELLLALSTALVIAGKVGSISTTAMAALGIMTLVVAGLATILGIMSYLNVSASLETAASLSLLLVSLSGACLILSGVGATGSAAFVGIGALATLIAAVGGIMAGLGALNAYFPQMEEFLNTGLGLLEKIGYGLGSFVGNIIGGFLAGTTSGLPEIGQNLSAFMVSATPFFTLAKRIDATAMDGVSALAGAILSLTAADVLNGLTSWLTGGSSLTTFGDQLSKFGASFKAYADEVGEITNMDVVTASASAAKSLAEFAGAIPNSGGWLGKVMGENSISAFGSELESFGPSFAAYAASVDGIGVDAVTASAAAAQSLAEFANNVPNTGGWLGKVMGENSISAFGSELESFGPSFAAYAASVTDIKPDIVTASANAAKTLAELASALPNSGGFAGFFAGNNNMDAFGEQLAAFGKSFKEYYDSISGISNVDKVNTATADLQALVDLAKGLDGSSLDNFGSFLKSLAETRLDDFLGAFENAQGNIKKAGENLGKNLKAGLSISISNLKSVGQDAAQGFINGLKSKMSAVSAAAENLGKTAEQATRKALNSHSPSKVFESIGLDTDSGLVQGLKKGISPVKDAGNNLVNALVDGASNISTVDIDSWIGKVKKAGDTETKVSKEIADAAKESSSAKVEAAKSSFEAFEEYIEEERFYNRISTQEQLNQYKNVLDTYKLTAEERKKVAREIYTLEKQLRNESYEHSMDWIEEEKYYNRLSLADELAAYKRVQSRYEKGTDERKKMDREVYRLEQEIDEARTQYIQDVQNVQQEANQKRLDLEQEYADKVTEINERLAQNIQSLNDEYQNQLKSRTNSLYQSYGLFDEVAKRDEVSGETLMKNLEGQVQEFGQWQDILDQLSAKGLDSELIEELQEMGPSALAQLEALNSMSDEELEKYASLWSIKHAQAREQATTELEGLRVETQEKIARLRVEADQELDEYRTVWQQKMAQVTADADAQLAQLQQEFAEKVGLIKTDTESELQEMSDNANEILREAGWDETGKQIVNGLISGVEENKPNFITALTEMALAGVEAVEDTLGIKSPSRVFAKLGNYVGLGFVNALIGFSSRAYDAGAGMATAAKDGLSDSIRAISDAVSNGIDTQPTIRPVIDLTDVSKGVGEMNSLLSRNQSIALARSTNSVINSSGPDDKSAKPSSQNEDVVSELRSLRADMATMTDKIARMQIVLSTGTLVGEIAGPMDSALGQRSTYKGRGN